MFACLVAYLSFDSSFKRQRSLLKGSLFQSFRFRAFAHLRVLYLFGFFYFEHTLFPSMETLSVADEIGVAFEEIGELGVVVDLELVCYVLYGVFVPKQPLQFA